MKIKVPLDKAHRLINHGPTVLISSHDGKKANVFACAWTTTVDYPPPVLAFVCSDEHYSFQAFLKTKQAVINIPNLSILKKAYKAGRVSGFDIKDKFAEVGLTPLPAKTVKAPLIKECFANLECKIIDTTLAKKYNMFICRVTAAWIEKSAFDKILRVDKKIAKTIHHLGGNYFTWPAKIKEA